MLKALRNECDLIDRYIKVTQKAITKYSRRKFYYIVLKPAAEIRFFRQIKVSIKH